MTERSSVGNEGIVELTAEIVASHAQNNSVSVRDLPELIKTVHKTLTGLTSEKSAEKPQPAVSVRRSITPDFIICLEGGRKRKMLKRRLATAYGMTPEDYREKWGLPIDYPVVALNYAKQRSSLAKKIGLGKRRIA